MVLWDAAHDYRKLPPLARGQDTSVNGVAFSPDGKHARRRRLRRQGGALGRRARLPQAPALDAAKTRPSPGSRSAGTGSTLAAAGDDGKVVLWDAVDDYRKLPPLASGQDTSVNGLAFSPDGKTLAAAGDDGKVVLWDAAHDYTKLPALDSGQNAVHEVAFSPDGNTLAAAGENGEVVLWDVAHEYGRRVLASSNSYVYGVAFSPDGKTLAAAGDRGDVALWDAAHDYTKLPSLVSGQGTVVRGRVQPGREDARRCRLRRQGAALGHLLDELRRPEGQGVRPRPRQLHRSRMGDGRARAPLQHDLLRLTGRRCSGAGPLRSGQWGSSPRPSAWDARAEPHTAACVRCTGAG